MPQRDLNHQSNASLAERLRAGIRRSGPLTFYEWMTAALYDEKDGYYCRPHLERWGRSGDYRTSPERSPLFAASFARYFATLYDELGQPAVLTILEAGAGAGHFAQTALETLQRCYPHVFGATRYIVDEASPDSSLRARRRLAPFRDRLEFLRLHEIERLDEAIIFANELLDAFPVHRVRMSDGRLRELYVGLDQADEFRWLESEPSTPLLAEYFERPGIRLAEGQTADVNLEAQAWLTRAAAILKRGYLILVDYGAEAEDLYQTALRPSGSLRAFRRHELSTNVLAHPGEQDLTTTVDWTHLRTIAEGLGLRTVLHEQQDRFLLRAGLLEQMLMMTGVMTEAEAITLRASAREMILPGGMNQSFQVLVLRKTADDD